MGLYQLIYSNAFWPRRYSMFLPYVRGSCVSRCWSGPRPGKGVNNVRPASSNRHNRSSYLSWTGYSLSALCVSIFTECGSPPLLDSEECAVFVDVRLPNSILSLHSSKNTPGLIQQRLHSSYEQMLVDRMCIRARWYGHMVAYASCVCTNEEWPTLQPYSKGISKLLLSMERNSLGTTYSRRQKNGDIFVPFRFVEM